MRKRIHQQIFWYCCLGIAFMLPVWGKLVPSIIVFLILNWLISGDYLRTIPVLFSDKNRRNTLLFAGLYVFYLFGLLYSSNYTYASFDLEVKLSLLIFPLIFSTADVGFLNSKHLRLIMHVYLAGCVVGSLLLLGHAFTLWRDGIPGAFYYMKLSWYFHSAYFAMYLNFAMAFIVMELLRRFRILSVPLKTVYYLLLTWFFVFIFLLSSKMGLICMVLIAALGAAELIFRQKKTFLGLGLIILFLMFVRAGLHVFSGTSDRVMQSTETLTHAAAQPASKSTSDRIDIWKVSLDIIKSNIWIGVGTGDVKDVLIGKYKEKKVEEAFELKLNAHNQYLQTFMTLGIPGIATLLLMLLLPMVYAFRHRYFLYFVFVLLFSVNIMVESMFETQAGVIWYAFFNIILYTLVKTTKAP
ncbi:MAG: O-antigen ligase family protein [Bacteroidetes bacterium]|nr:O-antigen ligase family protein [Bacteroidota bacterium]